LQPEGALLAPSDWLSASDEDGDEDMDIDSGVALLLGCVLLTLAGAVTAILAVDTWTRMTRGERAEESGSGDWLR
jgi:hypothetical protein